MAKPIDSEERITCDLDVAYAWDYSMAKDPLRDLYVKAKKSQWDGDALRWSSAVDAARPWGQEEVAPLFGSDLYAHLSQRERSQLHFEINAWTISQILHGEQGALLAASQLVVCVPDATSKLFAATQVIDEARHVELFSRYQREKITSGYPVSGDLKRLFDLILSDSRWDIKQLGMQVMVEGLAIASFAALRKSSGEPLLQELVELVLRDESRHVSYGVIALSSAYRALSDRERAEREDFAYEALRFMTRRLLYQEVWERVGLPVDRCIAYVDQSAQQQCFRQFLFDRTVPILKRIGLLSDRQRTRLRELGVRQFDHSNPFAPVG